MYFLNINKPKGISSFDCIRILRKKLGIKKIGHSGTLDPLASGVMQIAVGSATKLIDFLPSDKTYVAKIKFGYISDTMDEEGTKEFVSNPDFNKEDLIKVLETFVGISLQTPPKYSAVKQNGKKLCDIVRKNPDTKIEIPKRKIQIYYIKLLDYNSPFATIEVSCMKGTYIRSLVNDIGLKLKCGAYVSELQRIQAGKFNINDSNNLDSSEFNKINPIDSLDLEKYELNQDEYNKVMHGLYIKVNKSFSNENIILTKDNKLVSIAILSDNQDSDGCTIIKPKKNFNEG